MKAAEDNKRGLEARDRSMTVTGKEEFKVPKFIEDRETPAEIKAKKEANRNPNRPPDEALPHPESLGESKDEAWVSQMSEKMLNYGKS